MGRRSQITHDGILARRGRVADARLAGASLSEIAAAEQIDKSTASRDMGAVRAEWREHRLATFAEIQDQTAARLDVLLGAVWDRAAGGDLAAITAALQIENSRRRLLAIDTLPHTLRPVAPTCRPAATPIDGVLARFRPAALAALATVARELETADDAPPPEDAPPIVA
jgi:cysteine synthase